MDNWKISPHQYRNLIILYSIGTSVLITPAGMAADAKQDAWMCIILGTIIGLLWVPLFNLAGNIYPDLNYFQTTEKLLGRWLGKTISLMSILLSFVGAATLEWYVGNFYTTHLMPEMPIEAVIIFFGVFVIIGMYIGLETLARTTEILFPIVVFFLTMLIVFNIPNMDFNNLLPVFEGEIKGIVRGSIFFTVTSHSTLVVFLMIFPSRISKPLQAKKSIYSAILISGAIMLLLVTSCVLVMGSSTTALNLYPSYALAKRITLGTYISRIEAILAVTWLMTIFYKTVLYFADTVIGLTQVFGLKNYRSITIPLGIILIVLSFVIYPNIAYNFQWDTTSWLTYGIFLYFSRPILLVIVAFFRKKIFH